MEHVVKTKEDVIYYAQQGIETPANLFGHYKGNVQDFTTLDLQQKTIIVNPYARLKPIRHECYCRKIYSTIRLAISVISVKYFILARKASCISEKDENACYNLYSLSQIVAATSYHSKRMQSDSRRVC